MLRIEIPNTEYFDEKTSMFVTVKGQVLQLEHSLLSLSKWESKWRKPYLSREPKTIEECRDYVRCMTITQNVDPLVYKGLTVAQLNEIDEYINAEMTATTFNDKNTKRARSETVTAEIIYYWMIALEIPFECQKWHLNRLMTLIRVCNIKNQPPKKMNKKDIMSRNRAINAARRQRLNSRG